MVNGYALHARGCMCISDDPASKLYNWLVVACMLAVTSSQVHPLPVQQKTGYSTQHCLNCLAAKTTAV